MISFDKKLLRTKEIMKYQPFYLLLFVFGFLQAQESITNRVPSELSYAELIELYDENVKDSLYAIKIARTYIQKAKAEQDSTKIARGFSRIAFVSTYQEALRYLDSTIQYSQYSSHPNFPTVGYLFKSLYAYDNEDYELSLKSAIDGYRFAKLKDQVEHQIAALRQINGINELWGDYEQTLEAEKITLSLLDEYPDIPRYYDHLIASLEGIGKCYVRLQKPDSALYFFKKGITTSISQNDSISYYAFVSRSSAALFQKQQYQRALDSLEKAHEAKEYFIDSYPLYYHFYKASIAKETQHENDALKNLLIIDSIYSSQKILTPELPEVYNRLVNIYQEQSNKDLQLSFLQKWIAIDSLIDAKKIFVKNKTNQEYTIPTLLEGKNNFIKGLQTKNKKTRTTLWIAIVGLVVLSVVGYYYFNRQRKFKKRYETLMNKEKQEDSFYAEKKTLSKPLDISEEITQDILDKLSAFEAEKKYLSRAISLNDMAKSLGTNSTYLSKVINNEKGRNFSTYINHLRVAFAFEELKNNPTFRKYTIKAIAEESGFKNAESFSKTFYKVYGFYPSFYVKKLKNEK